MAADIEYRIVWSKFNAHWDIHRNAVNTAVSRRKKQSAIDTAILATKSELSPQKAKAIVTSFKDGSLKTEWVSPSNGGASSADQSYSGVSDL
jgi:hypothetical protein